MLRANRVPQSASMTSLWHPAIRADWLVLRRMGPMAGAGMLGPPVLLLISCIALACGDLYAGYGWCLAAAALLALGGGYGIAHKRLLDALEQWRFGWCGALPIAHGTAASTLLLSATAALVASLAAATALLFGIAAFAPYGRDLPYAAAGIDGALVVGVAVAAIRVFRRGALARGYHADGIREPLLALPWLNDPRLPHLLDWQRRAALVRWRRGGSFVTVGIVLAAVPIGAPMVQVSALMLLVLSWSWLTVVMRSSADAFISAVRLLAAVPWNVRAARMAAFRYPLVATLCALVFMAIGAALLRHGMVALLWIVCAGVASAWPLVRLARATPFADIRA